MEEEEKRLILTSCVEILMETCGQMPARSADNLVRIVADILTVINKEKSV